MWQVLFWILALAITAYFAGGLCVRAVKKTSKWIWRFFKFVILDLLFPAIKFLDRFLNCKRKLLWILRWRIRNPLIHKKIQAQREAPWRPRVRTQEQNKTPNCFKFIVRGRTRRNIKKAFEYLKTGIEDKACCDENPESCNSHACQYCTLLEVSVNAKALESHYVPRLRS